MNVRHAIIIGHMQMFDMLTESVNADVREIAGRKCMARIEIDAHCWRIYMFKEAEGAVSVSQIACGMWLDSHDYTGILARFGAALQRINIIPIVLIPVDISQNVACREPLNQWLCGNSRYLGPVSHAKRMR